MKKLIVIIGLILGVHSAFGQINLVFRCDDYRMKEDSLQEQIIDLFAKYQVPLNFCIIPADTLSNEVFSLSDSTLNKWRTLKEVGLLDIGLHGFMHRNLNPNYGMWNEFENLTYDEQVDRFRKGKEMIESHLGEGVHYFVPPRNVINEYTTQALKDCGFDILSANVANRINKNWGGVIHYPCTTEDFSEFSRFYYSKEYESYKDGTIILLFHGYTFTRGRYTLEQLDELLRSLSENKSFNICTFSQLQKNGVKGYDRGLQNKPFPLMKKFFGNDLFFLNRPTAVCADIVYYSLFALLGLLITIPFVLKSRRRKVSIIVEVAYLIAIGFAVFALPVGYVKSLAVVIVLGIIADGIAIIKKR